jgi:hypothetical protein
VLTEIAVEPASRWFLLDLDAAKTRKPHLLASACKALASEESNTRASYTVEGISQTPAIMLLHSPKAPRRVLLGGQPLENPEYSSKDNLLWLRFDNEATPRELTVEF